MRKISLSLILSISLLLSALCFNGCGQKQNKDISNYQITASLEDNKITGNVKLDFYNPTDNAFKELKFNLFANAYRKDAKYSPISAGRHYQCYYEGESYGGIEIISVKDDSATLEYSIKGVDKNVLVVNLSEEVFPGERTIVEIDYVITLANVISRTGITPKTINLANFYPILCGIDDQGFYECVYYSTGDPYFSDVSNYTVTFSYPEEYVVASSGVVKESKVENGIAKTTYSINSARSFCMAISKDYEVISDNSLGIMVNYYYYNDSNPKEMLDTAVKSVKYFSNTFGEYPYPSYSVCKTPFDQGGMEFPAITYISDALENKAFKEVIVHETAHQWWQTGVGNNEIEYGFLDEGLAEYSVVLFYENHPEYGFEREVLVKSSEKTYKTFCSVYDKLFGEVNTVMIRSLKDFSSEYEYVNVAYVKPCIMYDCLRKTVGEERFFGALKRYYKEYCFKNASPYDLISAFDKEGCDSEGYFESFFNGSVIL